MATATAEKTPIITDLQELSDTDLKTVLADVQALSVTLIADRKQESAAAAKKAGTWLSIQQKLANVGRDIAFNDGTVKLSYSPERKTSTKTPDIAKIEEVAPELIARKRKLAELLANVENEISNLAEQHFIVAEEVVKSKLTINAAPAKKSKK